MCLVLSGKVKVLWKLVLQNDEFLDAFSRLELLNSVTDEVIIYRNSCVHFMVTKMKPLRLKIFQMKGISDLALLPPGKNNLKLYISRAKYVANMYVNTIRLHMCLDDPIYHEWKQDDTVQWRDNCFPEISLMFWKLVTEKIMIVLANSNLLRRKAAIPVILKERLCYYNVDATNDVDIVLSISEKNLLPSQFVF